MNAETRKGVKEDKKSATSGWVTPLSSCFSTEGPAAGRVVMLIFWPNLRRGHWKEGFSYVQKKVEGKEELMRIILRYKVLCMDGEGMKNHMVPDEIHY